MWRNRRSRSRADTAHLSRPVDGSPRHHEIQLRRVEKTLLCVDGVLSKEADAALTQSHPGPDTTPHAPSRGSTEEVGRVGKPGLREVSFRAVRLHDPFGGPLDHIRWRKDRRPRARPPPEWATGPGCSDSPDKQAAASSSHSFLSPSLVSRRYPHRQSVRQRMGSSRGP